MEKIFFNVLFNKSKLKTLLTWCVLTNGQSNTINLAENLKQLGFKYATIAGISLGIDDFKTISTKKNLIIKNYKNIKNLDNYYELGLISEIDRSQYLINNWQKISEILKNDINTKFKSVNRLNPIYMMAFSGARGNISQVRQLIGMRGLMVDPNGQIIHLPITSNFREGLTVTEYLISCYGARKGVVDTALRTATAGYLTRRLVDSAQHVIVSQLDCLTFKGLFLSNLYQNNKIVLSLKDQLYGRVLAAEGKLKNKNVVFYRNQQIDESLAVLLSTYFDRVYVRSPLQCRAANLTVCQLCYGWNLSHLRLISLGEVIGVIAAQSIGEPGTQLTMRTFHTGGVFSGSALNHLYAPFNGIINYSATLEGKIIKTYENKIIFLVQKEGLIILNPIRSLNNNKKEFIFLNTRLAQQKTLSKKFKVFPYTLLFVKNKEEVQLNQLIAKKYFLKSNKSRIYTSYSVVSKIQGEVFLNDSYLIQRNFSIFSNGPKKFNTLDSLLHSLRIQRLQYLTQKRKLWVLSGRIYKPSLNVRLFPKTGDFICMGFPIAKLKLLSKYPSFLRILLINKNKSGNSLISNPQSLIFTEYPIYAFLVNTIKKINEYSIFTPLSVKPIENENIIRIKACNINHYNFFSSSFSFFKEKRINLQRKKLEQLHIFLKANDLTKYSESSLSDNNFLFWFPSNYLQKSDMKIVKGLINFPIFFSKQKKSSFKFFSKIFEKDYLFFQLNNVNKSIFKNEFLYIKKIQLNIFLKTSDFLINSFPYYNSLLIENYNNESKKTKIIFYPKTSLRYFFNNFLIRFCNYQQSNLLFSSNNICRLRIRSYSFFRLIKNFFISSKIKKNDFSFTNFFGNLISNYLLSFIFIDKTISNFLFYYFEKILFYQQRVQSSHYLAMLSSCFIFLERFGFFINVFLFWNKRILSKFLVSYFSSSIFLTPNGNIPLLILNYINTLTNQVMTNIIFFQKKNSVLNCFSSNFFLKKKKSLYLSQGYWKHLTGLFPSFKQLKRNFLQIELENFRKFYSFLNINQLDGFIISINSLFKFQNFNLLVKYPKQMYLESLCIPQFLREFGFILKKLRFWEFLETKIVLKYYNLSETYFVLSSFSLNFSNFQSINRKKLSCFNIFPLNFYSKMFSKNRCFNKISVDFFKTFLSQLQLKIVTPTYFLLKSISSISILSHTNFKFLFLNYNNNLSNLILDYRFKDLFFKNSFYLFSNKLYSLDSPLFNKKQFSSLSFSNLYKKIKISYFLQIPFLRSSYSYKYSYIEKYKLTWKFLFFKSFTFLNSITQNNFFIFKNQDLNSKLKIAFPYLSSRYLSLFCKFSIINPIFRRTFDPESFNGSIKDRVKFSFHHLNWVSRGSSIATISFLSPYEGEVLFSKFSKYSSSNTLFNQLIILTKDDVNIISLFRNRNQKTLIFKSTIDKTYYINTANIVDLFFHVGSLVYSASLLSPGKKFKESGQILGFTKEICILRKGKPLLYPLNGIFYVWNGDFINVNSPIMTLFYTKLKTGDIVQGIPKIEQFFESSRKNIDNILTHGLSFRLISDFQMFKERLSIQRALKRSIARIQKIVIDGILKVYCSQGISISRKHFEIIIKQMTSKVKIIDGGESGFIRGEVVSFYKIESINKKLSSQKIICQPIILGITGTAINTESFISSASFQQTARVLSKAAVKKKIDFLNGLKENIILGHPITGGTGVISFLLSPSFFKKNL
uniref:DNA-directed RNA polymerase n=1 Tax=Lotharella vacuolata TaxID=74820 RepID=A0A140JZW5_9EUKA|nr:RNA polymerase beta prime subunit [Lotharella vacuolata]BAU62642.1 RNA polymerase beta prime subunit [Lotharella vacuolata]